MADLWRLTECACVDSDSFSRFKTTHPRHRLTVKKMKKKLLLQGTTRGTKIVKLLPFFIFPNILRKKISAMCSVRLQMPLPVNKRLLLQLLKPKSTILKTSHGALKVPILVIGLTMGLTKKLGGVIAKSKCGSEGNMPWGAPLLITCSNNPKLCTRSSSTCRRRKFNSSTLLFSSRCRRLVMMACPGVTFHMQMAYFSTWLTPFQQIMLLTMLLCSSPSCPIPTQSFRIETVEVKLPFDCNSFDLIFCQAGSGSNDPRAYNDRVGERRRRSRSRSR